MKAFDYPYPQKALYMSSSGRLYLLSYTFFGVVLHLFQSAHLGNYTLISFTNTTLTIRKVHDIYTFSLPTTTASYDQLKLQTGISTCSTIQCAKQKNLFQIRSHLFYKCQLWGKVLVSDWLIPI